MHLIEPRVNYIVGEMVIASWKCGIDENVLRPVAKHCREPVSTMSTLR